MALLPGNIFLDPKPNKSEKERSVWALYPKSTQNLKGGGKARVWSSESQPTGPILILKTWREILGENLIIHARSSR